VRSDLDRLGEDRFLQDDVIQVWVLHHLVIVGEAARGLSESSRAKCPEIPWTRIILLRNVVVDEYFCLNLRKVWLVLIRELPPLLEAVERTLGLLRGSG
jgi:uncharacterized protein with HEPN domain